MNAPVSTTAITAGAAPSHAASALTTRTSRLKWRKTKSSIFAFICLSTTLLAFVLLIWLLAGVWQQGAKGLSLAFLKLPPSYKPEKAGIYPAIMGSLWTMSCTVFFAVPVGVGAAIFLQEFSGANRFARFVQVNIANLAGVPSIVYGILGLALFVRLMKMGTSVLAGSLTLGLLVLPIIIIASQEALRSVPSSLRDGSYALGATRWQTIRRQVLPVALPGIMTGIILALSRAVGEAAPLLIIGAAVYIRNAPQKLLDDFTVLPIQIFNWAGQPKDEFKDLAASGILVLLLVLLTMNALAIFLRYKFNKRISL
jgi:phosphate transport system permease protein